MLGKEESNFFSEHRTGSCTTNRKIGYIFLGGYRGKDVQINPALVGYSTYISWGVACKLFTVTGSVEL
jgi:hypothetical protein